MEQIPSAYTNVVVTDRRVVVKRYVGADALARHDRELTVLRGIRGRVPAPTVLAATPDTLTTRYVDGVHGQELLVSVGAGPVLRSCGDVLRRVHDIEAATVFGDAAPSKPLVHGDFGPNNVLIRRDDMQVSAVVDWEWSGAGDPVDDVAWCEWIIRTHHPGHLDALPEFFAAYGQRPTWTVRHDAMLCKMRALLAFSERTDPGGLRTAANRLRMAATEGWSE